MKITILTILCFPLILCAQIDRTRVTFEQGLTWRQIQEKAKTENKYVFIDVNATWCLPCKKMDKEIFTNDSIAYFVNKNFISIKLQVDSTGEDDQNIRGWYADAKRIKEKYKILGFPCFLFFSPELKLVYKDLGFKTKTEFLELVSNALKPENLIFFSQLEDFKKGNNNYQNKRDLAIYAEFIGEKDIAKELATEYLKSLRNEDLLTKENILFAKNVANNGELAFSLAEKYKLKFIDNFSDQELLKKENLEFISKFNGLTNSTDRFFHLCYTQPDKIDNITNFKGWADFHIEQTITKEELQLKVVKTRAFDKGYWDSLQLNIQNKYPKIDAFRLVLNYQIKYYRQIENWLFWASSKDKKIKKYPPQNEFETHVDINMSAWDAFLNCNNEKVLRKILDWMDCAIRSYTRAEWLDTKANILYKLGRINKATKVEAKAVALSPKDQEIKENFIKMKSGVPTWIVK